MVTIRSAYDDKRVPVVVEFDPEANPSLTHQSFKDECDINLIVARAAQTGFTPMRSQPLIQGDFSEVPDYQTAMNTVVRAREAFDALPAKVRDRFNNDPSQLLNFVSDEKNREEATKLGLIQPAVDKGAASAPHEAGEQAPLSLAKEA